MELVNKLRGRSKTFSLKIDERLTSVPPGFATLVRRRNRKARGGPAVDDKPPSVNTCPCESYNPLTVEDRPNYVKGTRVPLESKRATDVVVRNSVGERRLDDGRSNRVARQNSARELRRNYTERSADGELLFHAKKHTGSDRDLTWRCSAVGSKEHPEMKVSGCIASATDHDDVGRVPRNIEKSKTSDATSSSSLSPPQPRPSDGHFAKHEQSEIHSLRRPGVSLEPTVVTASDSSITGAASSFSGPTTSSLSERFGTRIDDSHRGKECFVTSGMVVIDYPDVDSVGPGSDVPLDRLLSTDDLRIARSQLRSSSSSAASSADCPAELHSVRAAIQRSEPGKRLRRASDTSSAYSGSENLPPSETADSPDSCGLAEATADSDDEEGYSEPEILMVRDAVRESLEKDPSERSEEDIETLLELMQHLPAFANMTLTTRRALCATMVFAVVDKAATVVMKDKEELDSWSVILNGQVEIRDGGTCTVLHMGDSFGITPTMEKLFHKGEMRTLVDDCQFVCIAQRDYYAILHQGEQNTTHHREGGKIVLVTEGRSMDGGARSGQCVIRGTPERLTRHLVEEHSPLDPTYVEDFLLTYRTFLDSPMAVAGKLLHWFEDDVLRDRVTRVVLLWVNNHYSDFEKEASMNDFLERFESLLEREQMVGQLRLLNIACAAKATVRTVILTRGTRQEILNFSVLGGLERRTGIFVTKVEPGSKAADSGLKRGDQILSVNNHNFEHISHNTALEFLRGTTHLSINVRSNILAFKEMLGTRNGSPSRMPYRIHHRATSVASTLSTVSSIASSNSSDASTEALNAASPPTRRAVSKERKSVGSSHRRKIRLALKKLSLMPKSHHVDDTRKETSSPVQIIPRSASNPDLSSQQYDSRHDFPEHVLKVYRADQMCKYILLHRETTAREVVMLTLQEFGITESSANYSLCEVSVENGGVVKQKRLPDHMNNLPDRVTLRSRYYLKNNLSSGALLPDDLSSDLTREGVPTLLALNSAELAAQLTLLDFSMFHQVSATEYVTDLFGAPTVNLEKFSQLTNQEMFWVVSEVVSEPNIVRRAKIIKSFIKISRHCKDCKNFNSMFAIISGLGQGSVSRLRNTWDKVPAKYMKIFNDLQDLMDPSRNMSKYRNLVASDLVQPPMIPFFPVCKKDITFINLGNHSEVDGLINFEKLRMISKEVRQIVNMASAQYDLANMLGSASSTSNSVFSAFSGGGLTSSAVATIRRKRRNSTVPNAKRMYEEALMVRRVREYLDHLKVSDDELKLAAMSANCEPPVVKRAEPSPARMDGPRFGTESTEAQQKIWALADKRKAKPHKSVANIKPPPSPNRAALGGGTQSQRTSPSTIPPLQACVLSAESSSVVSGKVKKSLSEDITTSPNSSVSSYHASLDNDSGHNSVGSADACSTSSSSPLSGKQRPPLPPYHVVVQNAAGYSTYYQQQYLNQVRPSQGAGLPPNYQQAVRHRDYVYRDHVHRQLSEPMALPPPGTLAFQQSYDAILNSYFSGHSEDELCHDDGSDDDEEQVSAV